MYKKKLIETSIPLDEINKQAVREKSIRKGHPSTLHLWWARRPLAAARCVIFASMVDDPAEHPEMFKTEEEQDRERDRLHGIIRALADWDNINDTVLYEQAYAEMVKYAPDGKLPEFLDPFAGGGALPLEAQRLGLVACAADLNPVPVMLNRAMIDLPARFCGFPPVHPEETTAPGVSWKRATGLAEDVEYYAKRMLSIAKKQLGENYPKVEVRSGKNAREATPIAYIWARTVQCPNPACRHETPLVHSFWLAKKKGTRCFVQPVISDGNVVFDVCFEQAGHDDFNHVPESTIGRRGGKCIHCDMPFSLDYVRSEGRDNRLGIKPMAIVVDNPFGRGRYYVNFPDNETPQNLHDFEQLDDAFLRQTIAYNPRDIKTATYGMKSFAQLFSPRQKHTLLSFASILEDVKTEVMRDAIEAGFADDEKGLSAGGNGAKAYSEAVSVYLSFIIDKQADRCSTLCTWDSSRQLFRNVFARQAMAMSWDFAEVNPFSGAAGSFESMTEQVVESIKCLPANPEGHALQRDATKTEGSGLLISTDPPYYDNIDYSDLSDYFYLWLRRNLRQVFPSEFATRLTPKADELVALPFRFDGGDAEAKSFFENGMRSTFCRLANSSSDEYPLTVYYAYKQSEDTDDGRTSSGWETMLQALMDSGLQITGTWPMRTEMANRTIASDSNALASSIVLVCRKRSENAPIATRPEFLRELRNMLRTGVKDLQRGAIAPVDMAQASIGPGMAAFSKYAQVIESDGRPMTVHTALGIINEQLDALMGESGEEFDNETRFCLTWYEQFGFTQGDFGSAETIRNARGASLEGLVHAGVLDSGHGKTRLLKPTEVADVKQARLHPSAWSDLMAIIAALESSAGLTGAAEVARDLDTMRAEKAKTLAYILFQTAERCGRTEDADIFNRLVTSWMDVSEKSEELKKRMASAVQEQLDLGI